MRHSTDHRERNRRQAVRAAFAAREAGDHYEESYLWGVAATMERLSKARPEFVASYRQRAEGARVRALLIDAFTYRDSDAWVVA